MSFTEQLKKSRIEHGLSPEQLSDLIGINIKTYKNYESGKTVPRIDVFKKIVLTLETTADNLLEIE